MAPALSLPPRELCQLDAAPDTDQQSHRRRALASVDNLSTSMEEDDMGLQNQPSLAKDSQEMEQILVDLGNSDLAQADLLQAIKTLESAGDNLSTGETDAIFPLSGFDLTEPADSEGDVVEDKIKAMQTRLERRCAFLERRLRILQARSIGKRVSEEVGQTFDKCTRGARKDGGGRPMGLKALLKRIETTSALQASAAARSVAGPKYYHAGSSKGDASRSASVGISSGTLTGLADTAGALRSHLSVVKHELDSDATASSSGAESNDEAVNYNNPHQQHMPIEKRALWQYQRKRAAIASRWSWLQAQVQELDYKIRQHTDLKRQVREAKGPVEFVGEPSAYQGSLPGSEPPEDDPATLTCARVRPLRRETFKKRKLLQMHNLHIATNKAAKPSDISCSCQWGVESCGVCTGRAEPTEPAPPAANATNTTARADPAFHPHLSTPHDITPSTHMAALTGRAWFRSRWQKAFRGTHHQTSHTPRAVPTATVTHSSQNSQHQSTAKAARRNPTRLKRGRPPLSRKIRERERDDDNHEPRRVGRPSTERRRASYDIDNIVIPQSVAAATRPQILTYKEIITPKWRVLDLPQVPLNNGVMKHNRVTLDDSEVRKEEDISDVAVAVRHLRAEGRERARYVTRRAPRHRPSLPALPLPLPPPPPADPPPDPLPPPPPPPPPLPQSIVRPYSPRDFPLRDDTYMTMIEAMPEGHLLATMDPDSPTAQIDDDDSSTLSPLSPNPFEGDDPDDAEWDPRSEKTEKRKNSFR